MKKIIILLITLSTSAIFSSFTLGVENIPTAFAQTICPDKKNTTPVIGLITNQTGINQQGIRTVEVLKQRGLPVSYIFVPEHGLSGVLAERDVHDSVDTQTNIPVISLYGNGSGKMISPEYLLELDCLVFDIQDSGMRHYTYISTLLSTMKIAAENNKPFVVLDRPNPLGSAMEGPLVDADLISFISIASIPLRHGMTIGELACYFNKHVLTKTITLHIVPMENYNRSQGFVGGLLQQLSPNLQSLQSVYGYSFLGLLGEVEPFDVGVGTYQAFRCITLPETVKMPQGMWERLQELLLKFRVKSFPYQYFNKKKQRVSKGLRLQFTDISRVHSFELFIAVLEFFKKEGIAFSFSAAFNKAVGTPQVQAVIAGPLSSDDFFAQVTENLKQFRTRAQECFLYKPVPVIFNKKIVLHTQTTI